MLFILARISLPLLALVINSLRRYTRTKLYVDAAAYDKKKNRKGVEVNTRFAIVRCHGAGGVHDNPLLLSGRVIICT